MAVAVNRQKINGAYDDAVHDGHREAFKLVVTIEKDHKVSKHPKQELYRPEIQLSHLTYGIHLSRALRYKKDRQAKSPLLRPSFPIPYCPIAQYAPWP